MTNKTATVTAVSPVLPPCSTPAVLSMKLVTVLVPSAAPATVPTASASIASRARGSFPFSSNPACSPTPIRVPVVSNTSMKRNMRITGIIAALTAWTRSIRRNVGLIDGGAETIPNVGLKLDRSKDSSTAGDSINVSAFVS